MPPWPNVAPVLQYFRALRVTSVTSLTKKQKTTLQQHDDAFFLFLLPLCVHAHERGASQNDHVPVAQLDKASDYESEDWGFKSLQGYLLLFLESEKMKPVEESYAQAGPFHAWMPEWSKGADLRSAGQFVRLGSNPSPGSIWGISSIGRVRALQARGTGIETPMLHVSLF